MLVGLIPLHQFILWPLSSEFLRNAGRAEGPHRYRLWAVGFGLPKNDHGSFFIRDIVFFGRASLRGTPFAGRDHIVEAQLPRRKVDAALRKAGVQVKAVVPIGPEKDDEKDIDILYIS
eukprot:g29978.t1